MITLSRVCPEALSKRRLASLTASLGDARVYLVGGAARDALLGLAPDDWDIVVPSDQMEAVARWAGEQYATFFPLHAGFGTRRLVFDDDMIFDVSPLRGERIEDDLALRDFTVNAIAVDLRDLLRNNAAALIDPFDGRADLTERRLQWVSGRSLSDDPLRMVRAYRLRATRGLRVGETARKAIRERAQLAGAASWERTREEFFGLLNARRSYPALRAMDDVGLLTTVFPEFEPMKGCEQNEFHHLDVWEHTLAAVDLFEREPTRGLDDAHAAMFQAHLNENVLRFTRAALIKLALLFHDVGKPQTRSVDDEGRVHFYGHEKVGAEIVKEVGSRLRMSHQAEKSAVMLVREHLRLMLIGREGEPSPRSLGRFIRACGADWPGVLLLSWADMRASRGPARAEEQVARTVERISRVVAFYDERVQQLERAPRLITGRDLMAALEAPQGPEIGRLLELVEEARLAGEIETRGDALRLAARAYMKSVDGA